MEERVCALILAAGQSQRMGAFKPLLPLGSQSVLETTVERALTAAELAVVVTGRRSDEVEALLRRRFSGRVRCVRNADYAATDMLHSVRLGMAALPPCAAFFLLPGDLPLVLPETFAALLRARKEQNAAVVFPTYAGRRRHPPLIDGSLRETIVRYDGRDGLRGLWKRCPEKLVHLSVEDPGTALDLDTPEDYQRSQILYQEQASKPVLKPTAGFRKPAGNQ